MGGVQDRSKHSSIYVVSTEGDIINGVDKRKRKKKRKVANRGRPECTGPKGTLCSGKNISQGSNYEIKERIIWVSRQKKHHFQERKQCPLAWGSSLVIFGSHSSWGFVYRVLRDIWHSKLCHIQANCHSSLKAIVIHKDEDIPRFGTPKRFLKNYPVIECNRSRDESK